MTTPPRPVVVVSVETLAVRVPRAPALGVTVLMLWTSVRSRSEKERVPVSVRLPVGVMSSVTAPVTSEVATMGTSLTLVTVMDEVAVVVLNAVVVPFVVVSTFVPVEPDV